VPPGRARVAPAVASALGVGAGTLQRWGSVLLSVTPAAGGRSRRSWPARLPRAAPARSPAPAEGEEQDRIDARIDELDSLLDESLAAFRDVYGGDAAAVEDLGAHFEEYREVRDTTVRPLALAGDLAGFTAVRDTEITPITVEIAKEIDGLVEVEEQIASAALHDAETAHSRALWTITSAVVGALGLAVGLSVVLGRVITSGLTGAVRVIEGLAEGRLDQRLGSETRDEVGVMSRALDAAVADLSETMRRIAGNADTLSAASEELSATSGQMSASAQESAAQAGSRRRQPTRSRSTCRRSPPAPTRCRCRSGRSPPMPPAPLR
jgi:hypothetical protein